MATVAEDSVSDSAVRLHRPLLTTVSLAVLRVAGAGLLGATAGIHAYLWNVGYHSIPTIGTLFLLDAIGAAILAVAILALPRRVLPVAAVLGALLELGTVGGLLLSTVHSLFGFIESSRATLYWQSVIIEVVGAVVLLLLAGVAFWRRTTHDVATPWW